MPDCKRCGKSFESDDHVTRHLKQVHAGAANWSPARLRLVIGLALAVVVGAIVLAQVTKPDPPSGLSDNAAAFGVADDPFVGNPDADVVVVAIEAPRCSACRNFHNNLLPELTSKYFEPGDAVLYYSNYRISNEDFPIGVMQECVYRVEGNAAFWTFTDALYETAYVSIADAESRLQSKVANENWDGDAIADCRAGPGEDAVDDDYAVGREYGAGTPTFWIFSKTGPAERVSMAGLDAAIRDRI